MDRFELKSEPARADGYCLSGIDRQTGAVVALKVLHVRTATEVHVSTRRHASCELSHPGIVRYFDRGTAPHGSPFIAMEWLEGEPWKSACRVARWDRGGRAPGLSGVGGAGRRARARSRPPRHQAEQRLPGGLKLTTHASLISASPAGSSIQSDLPARARPWGRRSTLPPEQARGRHDVDGRPTSFSWVAFCTRHHR